MKISLRGFGRRRMTVSVAGSAAVHLLVVAVLLWVKPPSTVFDVKRGEPLFVELPEADEPAQRGLLGNPTPPPPSPPAAPKPVAPAVKPAPAKAAVASPAPPIVAKAAPPPPPEPVTREPVPAEAAAPPSPPPVAPTPAAPAAEPPAETPREAAEATAPKVAAVAPPAARETVPDIRSALTGGGAGGLGEGRHGIYGDPVPLETKDPKYVDYFARIRPMIQAKWYFPCPEGNPVSNDCARRDGQLLVEIGVAKSGHLDYLVLKTSSGSLNMDEFALTAVKLAAPFPPVPESVGRNGVGILVSFRYIVLENSLTNLLR